MDTMGSRVIMNAQWKIPYEHLFVFFDSIQASDSIQMSEKCWKMTLK